MAARTILVVEDEDSIALPLAAALEREGYVTRVTGSVPEAIALAAELEPDLMLLDVMLSDGSGLDVCREVRRHSSLPIIMLTARGDETDRVVGLELGADDYVVKPYSLRELLLRIEAVLRRRAPAQSGASRGPLVFGKLRVDRDAHRVWVDEEEITLTALELRLLSTLLERRGRVQSRPALLDDVWGMSGEVTTRTVDTHVKRLREKLGSAGPYIETVRGVGYRFTPATDHASAVGSSSDDEP